MKVLHKDIQQAVIRCDKGDDVIKVLADFTSEHNIGGAFFSGIGATDYVKLSFYDLEKKEYLDKEFKTDLEIVSFSGNIGWLKGDSLIHGHGVFSGRDYQTVGGHVKELVVSATCELCIIFSSYRIERGYDDETGLNLMINEK